jgi:hypothetical protein
MKSILCLSLFLFCSAVGASAQRRTSGPTSHRSLFAVQQDGKWGYIDRTGNIAIKPQFDSAYSFHDGLAVVHNTGISGYINQTGNMVLRFPAPPAPKKLGIRLGSFSEGLASICAEVSATPGSFIKYQCRYIDRAGRTTIKPQFDDARVFSEGLAAVRIGERWGYINKLGKYKINPQFMHADDFSDGLALVSDGFIDNVGNIVIKPGFIVGESFSDGLAPAIIDNEWGYMDKTGKVVFRVGPTSQFDYPFQFSEGLAAVITGNKLGYIDRTGKIVIAPQFSTCDCKHPWFKQDDEKPRNFGFPITFSEGFAAALVGKKWGYIDKTGKMVINPQFDEAGQFTEGLALVTVGGRIGYIDNTGRYIWNPTN